MSGRGGCRGGQGAHTPRLEEGSLSNAHQRPACAGTRKPPPPSPAPRGELPLARSRRRAVDSGTGAGAEASGAGGLTIGRGVAVPPAAKSRVALRAASTCCSVRSAQEQGTVAKSRRWAMGGPGGPGHAGSKARAPDIRCSFTQTTHPPGAPAAQSGQRQHPPQQAHLPARLRRGWQPLRCGRQPAPPTVAARPGCAS